MNGEMKISYARERENNVRLKVIGVGGCGGNAINRMIRAGVKGVEFYAVNTDVQDLSAVQAPAMTLQIGEKVTRGLGTGSNHELGVEAALENNESIIDMLDGANMVFITAGMGGGTGTGASQVIANHASSSGILTVAVVTKPFEFEGECRMKVADEGIRSLMDIVDALIVVPNEKLFELDEDLTLENAYIKADEVLLKAVKGISDIINDSGKQNVDFADVQTAMNEKGKVLMGIGEAEGENRAEEATKQALRSPLLDNISIDGATGILYNITASPGLGLKEVRIIANLIRENAAQNAKIKFGVVTDPDMGERISITIIATGFSRPRQKVRPNAFSNQKPLKEQVQRDSEKLSSMDSMPKRPLFEPARLKRRQEYVFDVEKKPFNISEISDSYVNESGTPNLDTNPDSVRDEEDDFLEVPVFKRHKLTEMDKKSVSHD